MTIKKFKKEEDYNRVMEFLTNQLICGKICSSKSFYFKKLKFENEIKIANLELEKLGYKLDN